MSCINNIKIALRIELHSFSDASEAAYGACLYARSFDQSGKISVKLICSKSRVAPIKTISLPRLELNTAYLIAKLYKLFKTTLQINFDEIFMWSDSTITKN